MIELGLDQGWSDDVKGVHAEHQQFCDPAVEPNVYVWYHRRTAMIMQLLRRFAASAKTVLDIGCAQGTIAITLGEAGYLVTGNDIRNYYISYARMRDDRKVANFICDNFLEYQPATPFDAVIFTEVIEHVVDHATFLGHIFEVMAQGGVLIVTTPNHSYFRQPLPSFKELDMPEHKDKEFSADGKDHFYLFTKSELVQLLMEAGFEIVEHGYFLPFFQHTTRFNALWRIMPRLLLGLSAVLENSAKFCSQQYLVVRRPR